VLVLIAGLFVLAVVAPATAPFIYTLF